MQSLARFSKVSALSTLSFTAGFSLFAKPWPETTPQEISNLQKYSSNIIQTIQSTPIFQKLNSSVSSFDMLTASQLIPEAHRINHVGQGLLNSPQHLTIDPILFMDKEKGELYSFSHLGNSLVGADNKIHNGVVATLLDEELCFCGFSKLPSKRGVTAKLSIDFIEKAPPNSTVLLFGKVVEFKGRKCVIDGYLETLPLKKGQKPIRIANATCVLVEPKWFKYLNWVPLFD